MAVDIDHTTSVPKLPSLKPNRHIEQDLITADFGARNKVVVSTQSNLEGTSPNSETENTAANRFKKKQLPPPRQTNFDTSSAFSQAEEAMFK